MRNLRSPAFICGVLLALSSIAATIPNRRLNFQPVTATSTMSDWIVFAVRGLTNDTTARSAYSTAPATDTITSNTLCLAVVVNSKASSPDTPTFSGFSMNWVQVSTSNFNTLASPSERVTIFRSMTNNHTTGRGTADFAGNNQTGCDIALVQFFGVDTSGSDGAGAIVQSVNNGVDTTSNPTITLAALTGTTNAAIALLGNSLNPFGGTVESGWTEDRDIGYATPATGLYVTHRLATTDNTIAPTVASSSWAGTAAEIKAGNVTASTVPPPDIAWWRNPDGGGATVSAHVGPNLTTTASWVAGKSGDGYALSFDGAATTTSTATTLSPLGTNKMTLMMWLKFTATNATQMIGPEGGGNYNSTAGAISLFISSNGRITAGMNGTAANTQRAESTQSFTSGEWHHIAVLYDGTSSNVDLYFDGASRATTTDTNLKGDTSNFTTNTSYLGYRQSSGTLFLGGSADDIRLYSGDQTSIINNVINEPK